MNKTKLVKWLFNLTHLWNHEIHEEIERRIRAEHYGNKTPNPDVNAEDELKKDLAALDKMRTFYHSRMTVTANLLIGISSFLVAAAALVVALVALLWPAPAPAVQLQGNSHMTGFFGSLAPIIVGLLAAYATAILAEDYRRFRDGQSLAAALYGELQAHIEAFEVGIPTLKAIREHLKTGTPLNYMPPFEPPADPVYDSGVGRLGFLGPEIARDVAYTYQNINAFRAAYSTMTKTYSNVDSFILVGTLTGAISAAINAEERGKKALVQLDKSARTKYSLLGRFNQTEETD